MWAVVDSRLALSAVAVLQLLRAWLTLRAKSVRAVGISLGASGWIIEVAALDR